MSDLQVLVRFLLVLVGIGAAIHYFLMSNFITAAPHWLRAIALPVSVGFAVGMVISGLWGDFMSGLLCTLATSAAMVLVQLEAWREGAHVSEQLAKAAKFRQNQKAIIRGIVLGTEEFVDFDRRGKIKETQ